MKPQDLPKAYKLLSGKPSVEFCQLVSDHLRDGYVLYGDPIMLSRPDGRIHVGQAIVLKEFA